MILSEEMSRILLTSPVEAEKLAEEMERTTFLMECVVPVYINDIIEMNNEELGKHMESKICKSHIPLQYFSYDFVGSDPDRRTLFFHIMFSFKVEEFIKNEGLNI